MAVLQRLSKLLVIFMFTAVSFVSLFSSVSSFVFDCIDTYDREMVFVWNVDEGTNTFNLYISSSIALSTETYTLAEYKIEIQTYSAVSYGTFYYIFEFPLSWNGRYPSIPVYSVLTAQTSSYFVVYPVVVVDVVIQEIYQDIDGDGNLEVAKNKDDNINNGYESYRDFELNSQVYRRVDWDGDGVFEFLIDTNLDNKPDVLWQPHTQKLWHLMRRNVDRDGAAEYEVLGTNKFFDVSEGKFMTFCRLKGRVSFDGKALSFAKLRLFYEGYDIPFMEWEVDDNGNYDVYVTTLNVDKNSVLEAKLDGYLTRRQTLYLEHNKEYTVNFVLYPVAVEEDDILAFPNPVKKDGVLRIVIKSSRGQKVRVLLLDNEGSFVARLIDGDISVGQREFYFYMKYPVGFYYLVGDIGGKKFRRVLRIVD